jgi:ankyrin repeat protein/predicted phosphohydrolase
MRYVKMTTPLIKACTDNDSFTALRILEGGWQEAQLNFVDANGNTALICACNKSLEEVALRILDFTPEQNGLPVANRYTFTALFYCCVRKLSRVALRILDFPAHENGLGVVDKNGSTILIEACLHSLPRVALRILEFTPQENKLGQVDNEGNTALIMACEKSLESVALEILNHSAQEINLAHANKYGITALMMACLRGLSNVALKILNNFPVEDINLNQISNKGNDAYSFADKNGMTAVIDLIVEKNSADAMNKINPVQILPEGTILYRSYTPNRQGYWYSFSKTVPRGYCSDQPCEIGTYRLKKDLNVLVVSPLTMPSLAKWNRILGTIVDTRKEKLKSSFTRLRDLLGGSLSDEQLDILSDFPWRNSTLNQDRNVVRNLCANNLDGIVFEDNMASFGYNFEIPESYKEDETYRILQRAWIAYLLGETNWHDEVSVCNPSDLELVYMESENIEEVFEERKRHFEAQGYEDPENLAYLDLINERASGISYNPTVKILERSVSKIANDDVREYFEYILSDYTRDKDLLARIPKFAPEIQFISDLHVEKWGLAQVEPTASILIVGGDIAPVVNPLYEEQIAYFSNYWDQVLVILGNHEYFGLSIEETIITCREMFAKYPNVTLLQKDYIEIQDRIFVGCTLWSDFKNSRQYYNEIRPIMKDFTLIRKFSPADWQALFIDQRDWLARTLKSLKWSRKQIVVITHHAPLYSETSHPFYRDHIATRAFGTNMKEVFPDVDIWLFGHTHYNVDKQKIINGHTTYVLSNACIEGDCASLNV